MQNFGEYLKQLRNDCGLSLYKVYEKTGITDSRLSKAENGAWCNLKLSEIRKLADQSKESTQQIEQVVSALLNNSHVSVEITQEVSEAFLKQNEKIVNTEEIFAYILKTTPT